MSFSKSSKKLPNQEMAQVDSPDQSRSPFWAPRAPSKNRNPSKPKELDRGAPIGAAYSHASLVNYSDVASHLPRTDSPSLSSRSDLQGSFGIKTAARTGLGSNSRYPLGSQTAASRSWSVQGGVTGNGDEEEQDIEIGLGRPHGFYEDDEDADEFGLPTVAYSRKNSKNPPSSGLPHYETDSEGLLKSLSIAEPRSSVLAKKNSSSDIAEERHAADSAHAVAGNKKKILRPQYKEILDDPVNSIHLIKHQVLQPNASPKEVEIFNAKSSRISKFKRILQASSVSLPELRDSAWSGVPEEVRSVTWQMLLGYLPTNVERRAATLQRKRRDYLESVRQLFERNGAAPLSPINSRVHAATSFGRNRGLDENVWHQISIDVPRTSPHIELYSYEATQRSLERILYLWAIRHPASGYVQGINDLVTPFWQVFLGSYVTDSDIESGMDPGQLPRAVIDAVEADSYWCLTKLLDGIQDSYIYAQPGIVRQVGALRDLTHRIDKSLAKHLEREGIEFMQFSFRWMNCLLMREVNVKCTIRMWDTYMAEEQGFSEFHLYVCAAFLVKWTDHLLKMDFQEIMMFLQALPTKHWGEKDIELLLSEAFIWQSLFRGSSAHLRNAEEPKGAS